MSTPRQAVHEPTFEAVVVQLLESDIRRMIEQHSSRFLEVMGCPACGSPQRSWRCAVHGLDHQSCLGCGAVYISPRPPDDAVHQFYQESESLRYWRTIPGRADSAFPA
jgi:ribosomal protein S27E